MATQLSLLGAGRPEVDRGFSGLEKIHLDATAWIEVCPGWVRGHDELFRELRDHAAWKHERRVMYEREVDVPRLTARIELNRAPPILAAAAAALEDHVGTALPHISLALYRDGQDSVAWHRDLVLRDLPESVMAIVSLGEPRRFLLRPLGGGRSHRQLGWGDLLILGGTVQRTWEHCVPKLRHAGPRMSVMLRPRVI